MNEAGQTMSAILKSVTDVTVIMKQIAEASEEQSKGISQVGIAVTQMDGVTQQNASLVEQVSAAAAALEVQTQALQSSVQKFRLSAQASESRASSTPRAPLVKPRLATAVAGGPAKAGDNDWTSF